MTYRSFTSTELEKVCKTYSKVQTKSQKGAQLVFTERGARLLGLFPDPGQTNVLWVHHDIEKIAASGHWLVGGDRLWIAPERNYYYENPRDFSGVHVPPGMDPGDYRHTGGLTYTNTFSLLDLWHNEPIDDTVLERSFELLADPYATGLPYGGVSVTESISIPATRVTLSLWSITQTYTCGKSAPGTGLFPINKGSSLVSYFNPVPKSYADVQKGYARFRLDSSRIYKIAVKPEDVVWANPLKDVYVSPYPKGNKWFLIAKRSGDLPKSQADCVDVARDNPEGPMGAIQSYNNGPEPGVKVIPEFGEIEFQLTKATAKGKKEEASARHELLAYAGTKKQILELAGTMLGIDGVPAIY